MKATLAAAGVLGTLMLTAAALAADPELQITIGQEVDGNDVYPQVTLENSVFRAIYRLHDGGPCVKEHAIRDWIIKSIDQDQVSNVIEACAHRGPMQTAAMTVDQSDVKTVHLEFGCPADGIWMTQDVSIFPHSPVIRVDYLTYRSWTNSVEIGTPGGSTAQATSEWRIYGEEDWIRPHVFHEDSYWSPFDIPTDPEDAGSLNYHDHIIMAVAHQDNGVGFGRVMPIYSAAEQRGGIGILKLLPYGGGGFETFAGYGQSPQPAFTGAIYVFTEGLDHAIQMGQAIADGDWHEGGAGGAPAVGGGGSAPGGGGHGAAPPPGGGGQEPVPAAPSASSDSSCSACAVPRGQHPLSLGLGATSLILALTIQRRRRRAVGRRA